uniref:Uncharacterized protein n=1 Tax=Trichobilharzia regenti TaxID=157069 RepID=A0AA85KL57_TRIRE|nr:unnamed protein product [Trichobilharzia regenti]
MDQTDEVVLISHEAKEFYDEIRGLVVVFLIFTFLFLIAHTILQLFLTKTEYELKPCRAERLVYQLVLGMCTFILTIGLTSYSLLPLTIITNEILVIFPQSYYVQWLNSELIQDLILLIDIGSKISCLTIPFSYFLLISQGFLHKSYSSFASRLTDSFIMVFFFYILCFGTVWSLSSFVSALKGCFLSDVSGLSFSGSDSISSSSKTFSIFTERYHQSYPSSAPSSVDHHAYYQNHPFTFLQNSINSIGWIQFFQNVCLQVIFMSGLELIQMTATLLGLLLLFICTPMGLLSISINLVAFIMRSLSDSPTRQTLYDRIEELNMETMTVLDDMKCIQLLCEEKNLNNNNNTNDNAMNYKSICFRTYTGVKSCEDLLLKCTNEFNSLNTELLQLKQRITPQRFTPFTRDSIPLFVNFCLVLLCLLLRLLQSFVFFNILDLLWSMFFGSYASRDDNAAGYLTMGSSKQYPSTTMGSSDPSFTIGVKPVSSLGHIGAVFQVCLVVFLVVLGLWGFYSLPFVGFLRPRYHSTSLDIMLVNVLLFLILSTALPLQTNLLGLTTLTLPNPLKSDSVISTQSKCSDLVCNPLENESDCDQYIANCPSKKLSQISNSWWNKLIGDYYYFDFTYWYSFVHVLNPFTSSTPADSLEESTTVNQIQTEEQTIFRQFVSRAFGYSSVSPSYELSVVILMYNICFLITSMWIAGRQLGNAGLSMNLDLVTTLRCLHQFDITSRPPRSSLDRTEWMAAELSCPKNPEELDQSVVC